MKHVPHAIIKGSWYGQKKTFKVVKEDEDSVIIGVENGWHYVNIEIEVDQIITLIGTLKAIVDTEEN